MWSTAILLLLVGAAFAEPQYGWRDGKEYTYKIRSRTLASFNQKSKQYTGILIEGKLKVQPNGANTLRAKIEQPRYSQIHTRLDNGWESEIPREQLNMQNLPLSSQPFEIKTKNGVVQDLVVDKDTPTWEVNIIKSFVSQLQVDTQGENALNSPHNQYPENEQPFGMYKTMEDSVSGKCEVLYDISPLPEKVLQNKPELAPMPELREDGEMISVVKTKNYSDCDQRVSYHFGVDRRNKWEPGSNDNSRYLSRSTVSRIVLSGKLRKYTIQSSVTINKVMHSADKQENEQGMVASKTNLTLNAVKDISEQMQSPSNPQSTGNLVYNYNNPFDSNTSRRQNKLGQDKRDFHLGSSQEQQKNRKNQDMKYDNEDSDSDESSRSDSSDSMYDNDDNNYLQPRPKLTEAPRNPMLPFFIGNNGNNIQKNNKIDAVKSAKDIAQQIGNEMQKPDTMPEEQTLEKFTILTRLVRTMNSEQIAEVQRELYQQRESANQLNQNGQGQNTRRNAWVAFRDAVAQAGTGPALVNIKQWIQNKQIENNEAAQVVDSIARSARTPTPEFMDVYFEMAMQQQTKEQPAVRDAAILAFADLMRQSIVDKQSAHNRYPVHAFGRLFPKKNRDLHEKYFPRLAEELQKAIDNGDSKRIQVYANAIGRTGHPRLLSVFEPYLEGRKPVSPFQRLVMVLSLNELAQVHPKTARSVLYKIYSNAADHHEIRTAAVYLLMETNPPASMLQRMAEYTNYDSNKHVNSAVKSTIESLARLDDDENRDISNAARAAQPLLTSENFRLQHSRAAYMKFRNPFTQSGLYFQANYIGSDDSIVPKGFYVSSSPTFKGIKLSNVEVGGAVSSVRDLWNFAQEQFYKNVKNNNNNAKIQKAQEQKFSPENIAKMLGIHGDEPEQVEGYMFAKGKLGNHFFFYDNHTLEKIPQELRHLAEEMKRGKGYEDARLTDDEVTISFPTETGFPFSFVLKTPTIMTINGLSKLNTESDSDNQSALPKSVTVSGKVRIVLGMEVQKRLGFVTPFEHQQYIVGIDKNVQVHLPVRGEINYDRSKHETRVNVQPNEDYPEFKVLQYKTQPFTSKHDILNMEPILKDKNTHIIHKDRTTKAQMQLNDPNNKQRVQFDWERQTWSSGEQNQNHETKKRNDMESLNRLATSIASLYYPNNVDAEYQKYSVKVNPGSDMTAEMMVSYDSMRTESENNSEDNENYQPQGKAPRLDRSLSNDERKEKLMREAAKNINSAKSQAIDISFKLNGPTQSSLSLTGAIGRSEVDQKARGLLFVRGETKEGKNYYLSAGVEEKSPNLDSLDYEENLKANTGTQFNGEIRFGKGNKDNIETDLHKIRIDGKGRQTEERKNEIRQSRDAQACSREENQNGNKMTKACKRVNQRTNLMNVGEITLSFENEESLNVIAMPVLDTAEKVFEFVAETKLDRRDKSEKNKVKINFQLSPNDEKVDVVIKSPEGKIQVEDIKLIRNNYNENNGNVKDSRNEQDEDNEMTKNNVCNLDKTQAKTFDNKRYSLKLGQCWHVAMTTFPKNNADNPSQQMQIPENMHVTILAKENEDGQKELKITLGEKEIKLSASAPRQVKAKVNGEQVELHKKKSYQGKQDNKVTFELFKLSDNSVKLTSDKYDIEIVYDGVRAQIETGERYRNTVRGLCGNNDGESENDQKTPKGCLLRKPEEFSATYALINDSENECQGPARENAEKAKNSECTYDNARSGNVISDREAGREYERRDNNKSNKNDDEKKCTKHRTMVNMNQSEICFSMKPVPKCSSTCSSTGTKSRSIDFHCVPRTSASEKVAQRVEKGANPDLSQKQISKTETHQVPISCKA